MRIATITNWAYGATVFLTMAAGITMVMASSADRHERAAVEERATFDQLTETIETDTYELTNQARLFTVSNDPSHPIVYARERAELGSVEQRTEKLRDAGANATELESLKEGLRWADTLQDEQEAAIAAVRAGHDDDARKILFGPEYERELERVGHLIGRFQYMLDQRTEAAVARATEASRQLRTMSEAMVAITALLFLFVLYFILKRRILKPVVKLSDVVTRLAAQDFDAEPPHLSQIDEIGDMAQAIRIFRENGLERQRLEKQRDANQAMRDLLSRMTQRLQGCETMADLSGVVRLFAAEIAPAYAGRLYVHDPRSEMMVASCGWHDPCASPPSFPQTDCWALRRGQLHRPMGDGMLVDVPCAHAEDGCDRETLCLPLTAQGETIGLIYFERRDAETGDESREQIAEVYLELLAETVGLALANLRLREALQDMALNDQLTGLANRHRLEAMLQVQLAQADRAEASVSCLMLDVDHFKRFNDRFGHEAGDAVLRAVGGLLSSAVRDNGTAFRYGGEEFLLLLPGFTMEQAKARAELIRERVSALRIEHGGALLGPVTISIGIATCPDHGCGERLLPAADAALLRAKEQGRDRVVAATLRAADADAAPVRAV